jgi:two-component system, chemotaxis family, chemotaxis protein CheY
MGQKTVLIVDDSRLARMMTQKTITQLFPDWKTVSAKSAEEGMVAAEETPVAIALIDYNMPGMNGLEMAALLLEKYPKMIINLVTANIQEKLRARTTAMGIGFITKPISEEKLSQLFQEP